MKKAVLVKELSNWNSSAKLFKLSEPLDGNTFVIVSALSGFENNETIIFGANEKGVANFIELTGSLYNVCDHKLALEKAGYEIVDKL
jgi:hypothetical protein